MATKREAIEQTIASVITNYRSSPTENEAMVAMAMSVLDGLDVFIDIKPKATKQEPIDFSYLRLSAWGDDDEAGVDLYCDRCTDAVRDVDETTLAGVVDLAITHIKENHS